MHPVLKTICIQLMVSLTVYGEQYVENLSWDSPLYRSSDMYLHIWGIIILKMFVGLHFFIQILCANLIFLSVSYSLVTKGILLPFFITLNFEV